MPSVIMEFVDVTLVMMLDMDHVGTVWILLMPIKNLGIEGKCLDLTLIFLVQLIPNAEMWI